ncbi:Hypothetical predicted protein [Pelobates cultripes]|uniref:Helix-turn-helix domain-containing protein n=1 Tax=Pelobates cultripes TaxID=61616 RepID=A0AAD1SYC9_PELCU|nr:Hypothetical predicted protein [Pelobates cultripes]
MVKHINELPTPVRMTAVVSTENVQFLNVELSVEEHRIAYSLYSKPTDRNTILHHTSAHPTSLKNSIPRAQFLRVMRNNSKETVKQQQILGMKITFLERGYSEEVLNRALEEAKKKATTRQDTTTNPKLVFPMTFHNKSQKISNIVRSNWNVLAWDNTLPREFKEPRGFVTEGTGI